MRIITVNLPVQQLKKVDSMTGHKGLYPSRSELIRVAVRDFLIHELDTAAKFQKFQIKDITLAKNPREIDEKMIVRVPISDNILEGFKTYKLGKKDES